MWGFFSKAPKIEDTLFNITMTAKQLEKMSAKEEKKGEQSKKRMVDVSDILGVCIASRVAGAAGSRIHYDKRSAPLRGTRLRFAVLEEIAYL